MNRFGWRLAGAVLAWQAGAFGWFLIAGYCYQFGTP